jgi:hypothetical protein
MTKKRGEKRNIAIYRRYATAHERMLREGAARLAVFLKPLRGSRVEASGPVTGVAARKLVAWDGVEPPTRGFSAQAGSEDHSPPNTPNENSQALTEDDPVARDDD